MRVLLAGEQWTTVGTDVKGFDYVGVNCYHEGGQWLKEALEARGHQVDYQRSFEVPRNFPERLEELQKYQAVILSDIGSNSFLFHPEVLTKSVRRPNRLQLIKEYVQNGGGLLMIVVWMSFQGIDGRARFHRTPVEEVLPVMCEPTDDRAEHPEGVFPTTVAPNHPLLRGIEGPWPYFLGYNRTIIKPQAELVLTVNGDPFLAGNDFGRGRAAVFTTDCSPHWGPHEFMNWRHYATLWDNIVTWLARK